jgi:hypothetical protein
MKNLLLIFTALTCAQSLQSMDPTSSFTKVSEDRSLYFSGHPELVEGRRTGVEIPKNLAPISLPQIYCYLSENMNQDIASHILSLQPGSHFLRDKPSLLKKEDSCMVAMLTTYIEIMLNDFGHCLIVELLKQSLLHKNVSICDFTNNSNENVLHMVANGGCLFKNICTETAKIFLEVAGNETLKLLTMQTSTLEEKSTALHIAAQKGHVELVELLLDAAGDHVRDFMNILNIDGKAAFDIARPKVKAVMLPYLQNNQ